MTLELHRPHSSEISQLVPNLWWEQEGCYMSLLGPNEHHLLEMDSVGSGMECGNLSLNMDSQVWEPLVWRSGVGERELLSP